MSGLLIVALLSMAEVTPAAPPSETRCNYMVSREGRIYRLDTPEVRVLSQTAVDGPFSPGVPAGATIRCGRSDIVPAANDWKVLAAGYPLVITEVTEEHDARIAILEMVNGRVNYRYLTGRMTQAEAPRVQARLREFQLNLRN